MNITSPQQLEKYLSNIMVKVLNDLSFQIENKLKEFIDLDIYDTYNPSIYQRTYEFRDKAWLREPAKALAKEITSSISYYPSGLTVNSDTYTHIDANNLAQILNRGSRDGWKDWTFWRANNAYPSPFFDHTLEWLNKEWNSMAKKALKAQGLNVA